MYKLTHSLPSLLRDGIKSYPIGFSQMPHTYLAKAIHFAGCPLAEANGNDIDDVITARQSVNDELLPPYQTIPFFSIFD